MAKTLILLDLDHTLICNSSHLKQDSGEPIVWTEKKSFYKRPHIETFFDFLKSKSIDIVVYTCAGENYTRFVTTKVLPNKTLKGCIRKAPPFPPAFFNPKSFWWVSTMFTNYDRIISVDDLETNFLDVSEVCKRIEIKPWFGGEDEHLLKAINIIDQILAGAEPQSFKTEEN